MDATTLTEKDYKIISQELLKELDYVTGRIDDPYDDTYVDRSTVEIYLSDDMSRVISIDVDIEVYYSSFPDELDYFNGTGHCGGIEPYYSEVTPTYAELFDESIGKWVQVEIDRNKLNI